MAARNKSRYAPPHKNGRESETWSRYLDEHVALIVVLQQRLARGLGPAGLVGAVGQRLVDVGLFARKALAAGVDAELDEARALDDAFLVECLDDAVQPLGRHAEHAPARKEAGV